MLYSYLARAITSFSWQGFKGSKVFLWAYINPLFLSDHIHRTGHVQDHRASNTQLWVNTNFTFETYTYKCLRLYFHSRRLFSLFWNMNVKHVWFVALRVNKMLEVKIALVIIFEEEVSFAFHTVWLIFICFILLKIRTAITIWHEYIYKCLLTVFIGIYWELTFLSEFLNTELYWSTCNIFLRALATTTIISLTMSMVHYCTVPFLCILNNS